MKEGDRRGRAREGDVMMEAEHQEISRCFAAGTLNVEKAATSQGKQAASNSLNGKETKV